jgi:hypothetical protein
MSSQGLVSEKLRSCTPYILYKSAVFWYIFLSILQYTWLFNVFSCSSHLLKNYNASGTFCISFLRSGLYSHSPRTGRKSAVQLLPILWAKCKIFNYYNDNDNNCFYVDFYCHLHESNRSCYHSNLSPKTRSPARRWEWGAISYIPFCRPRVLNFTM